MKSGRDSMTASGLRRPFEELPVRMGKTLRELANARALARQVGRSLWDFAVEVASLEASTSELRWLISIGYAAQAEESTRPKDVHRTFRRGHPLRFGPRSCFVITEAGWEQACCLGEGEGSQADSFSRPCWDAIRRELRWGVMLVKRYRLPSPNQETILQAFEEEGWPAAIDDPLRPSPCQDAKRRLHDTVKSLNRHQVHRLLRFQGNGTGEGVLWEPIDVPGSLEGPRSPSRLDGESDPPCGGGATGAIH